MADVTLTVQQADRDGLTASYTSIDNVDTYYAARHGGNLLLHFKNTNASPATITFDVTQTRDGVSFADPTVTVPATTGDVFVGGLGDVYEATGTNAGKVKFSCSLATGVTVAAIQP